MGGVALLMAGVVLTIGGCGSSTADGGGSPGAAASASKFAEPRQALVKWAGQMCEATKLLGELKTNSAYEVRQITDPPKDAVVPSRFVARGYLSQTSSSLDEILKKLHGIRPSGIATADRLHDDLTKEVERVRTEVPDLDDSIGFDRGLEESVDQAERLGKKVASLKMPDLAAVAAADAQLSVAYRAAPECAPPKPLPEAADGTDFGACKDGTCEILVTKRTYLTVGGWRMRVSLAGTKAKVRSIEPDGGVGEVTLATGGHGTFGEANRELTVKAVAVNEDGAVLQFYTT